MPVETENTAGAKADKPTRCGVVALVGLPNAGKSTLVNALVGQKVAIASPKRQTTRMALTGIAIEGNAQLLLVDTPGVFRPKKRLDRAMAESLAEGVEGTDLALLVADVAAFPDPRDRGTAGGSGDTDAAAEAAGEQAVLERLRGRMRGPFWLVLNKCDLVTPAMLVARERAIRARFPAIAFARVFAVSALRGDGVAALKQELAGAVPEGPFLYDADQVANAAARDLATELVREQLFLQLGQEIPYESAVHCEQYRENDNGSITIHAQIFVNRDSQKKIVVGGKGQRIREIGARARQEMQELFGRPVHLFLHVKARPGWGDDRHSWRDLGLRWVD